MKTVMVVDDIPANLEVLFDYLSVAGYRVLVAESGERCLEQLTRELPDLILLDLMMPGIDGIETCRRIKRRPDWSAVPIIVITAADAPDKKVEAYNAGAADFLGKPIRPEEVQARVQTQLRLSELERKNRELQNEIAMRRNAERNAAR